MFDLDQAFPATVRVRFGGRRVAAGPLRLRQLATLQAWLRDVVPHPLAAPGARAELARLDPPGRAARAAELLREGARWPVRLFTAAADTFLDTPEGRAVLAEVGLAEHNPGVPAADLAARATEAEWVALARVLFVADPVATLLRIADPGPDGDGDDGDGPVNWGRVLADLARDGRSLADVAEWTLDQLAAVRGRGERPGLLPRARPGESLAEACARRRRVWRGDEADEAPEPIDDDDRAAIALHSLIGQAED